MHHRIDDKDSHDDTVSNDESQCQYQNNQNHNLYLLLLSISQSIFNMNIIVMIIELPRLCEPFPLIPFAEWSDSQLLQ